MEPEAGDLETTARRTPAGDAFSAMVVRLIRLQGFLSAAGDALARPSGQSTARWQVLAVVENGSVTVADIARALTLARQSVQRVADILADEGLVAYEANPRHERAKLVSLTQAGRVVLATIQGAQRGWADELGAEIGVADLERLGRLLDKVLRVAERHPPAPR